MMALQTARVPVLDPVTGRFPDAYQPPQVAADAAAAAQSATDADTSATGAAASETAAASSATAAQTARTGAADSATSAQQARTGAETARDAAASSATAAQTARTGAETARTGAETAQTGAETAQSAAANSATAAQGSAADAQTAQTAAETARDQVNSLVITPTVTTLAPGSSATATITGTTPAMSLALGIPQGIQGAPGNPTEYELRGTGSPEGVVTAGLRVYYTDEDATCGAVRWRKDSATGNTGWVCVEGYTGWRDVRTLLNAEWSTINPIRLLRDGNTVYCQGRLTRVTAGGGRVYYKSALIVPTGFSPVDYIPRGVAYLEVASASYPGTVTSGASINDVSVGGFSLAGIWTAGDVVRFQGSWLTTDAWPTTLPGVVF